MEKNIANRASARAGAFFLIDYGGAGDDTFIYKSGEGTDTIFDYQRGDLSQILNFNGKESVLSKEGGTSLPVPRSKMAILHLKFQVAIPLYPTEFPEIIHLISTVILIKSVAQNLPRNNC